MLSVVNVDGSTPNGSLIDEIVREGARRVLAAAHEAEANAYIAESADERDGNGRRGMRAPVLAVGDGALSLWKTLAEVFPETREQRCRVHKTANVLDSLPRSAQPGAKKTIQDICSTEDRDHAEAAIRTFAQLYGAKFPKAAKRITDDREQMLTSYDFLAEHWVHLRTTNLIESTFSTVRLRTKVTRGAGSRTAALSMVFKLAGSAQARWQAVNAPHPVALVRAGARFEHGRLIERPGVIAV